MKKTKKLLACLIAAATMFTMGSTAFAEETETPTTYTDQSKVTIKKQYNLEGQGSHRLRISHLKLIRLA